MTTFEGSASTLPLDGILVVSCEQAAWITPAAIRRCSTSAS
jgi:hypothetical protein